MVHQAIETVDETGEFAAALTKSVSAIGAADSAELFAAGRFLASVLERMCGEAESAGLPTPRELALADAAGQELGRRGLEPSVVRAVLSKAVECTFSADLGRRHGVEVCWDPLTALNRIGEAMDRLRERFLAAYAARVCLGPVGLSSSTATARELTAMLLEGPTVHDAVETHLLRQLPHHYVCATMRMCQRTVVEPETQHSRNGLRSRVSAEAARLGVLVLGVTLGEVVVAVPMRERDGQPAQAPLEELADFLARAYGGSLSTGRAFGTVPLRTAITTSRQIAALAEPQRSFTSFADLEDVLLELAVTRSPDVDAALRRLLAPLASKPSLMETLRTLYAHELHRGQTAASLHIHPRTVDYRIALVRRLMGLDPTSVRGIAVYRTAMRLLDAADGAA